MGSAESAPRICRSQRHHTVAGALASLHPIGQPIIQSEKDGLQLRVPGKDRLPSRKVTWRGSEGSQPIAMVGRAPAERMISHMRVQVLAACQIPN